MAKNFFRLEKDDKGRWFFIDQQASHSYPLD
jgi:hypothetical protein